MNQGKEDFAAQFQRMGASLGKISERLESLERELQSVKTDAGAEIASIRAFLESDSVAALSGPGAAAGAEVSRANEAIQKLAVGENQEQILEIFLKESESFVDRAILFLNENDRFSPWKSLGFEQPNLESISLQDTSDPIVRAADQKRIIYRADSVEQAFPWVAAAGPTPRAAVCIPLIFQDFAPIVFYGDSQHSINLDPLELLSHLTVLVLKNNYLECLLTQAKVEEPAVVEQAPDIVETREPTPPPLAPTPEVEPALAAEEIVYDEEPAESAPAPTQETVFDLTPEAEEAPSRAPAPDLSDSIPLVEEEEDVAADFLSALSEAESAKRAIPRTGVFPTDLDEPKAVEDLWDAAEPTEIAPEPAEREAVEAEAEEAPGVPAEELERYHNEAQRFARLLISEIKLYNEDAVEQGRSVSDIYSRLKRDIARSREMYERRVHPAVRAREDHFHREIVRILARGQQALMGPDYPGPKLG